MSDNEHGMPSQDGGIKQEDPNATINIKVVSSTGEEVFFKIKRSTKLSKLQGAYASKVGKDVSSIRFLYDGERIQEEDTPASLDMEDNDTIDVMVEPFPSPRPAASSFTAQSTLPDPFQYFSSTRRVSSPEEWYACRQPEIKRVLQEYQFGFYPDKSAETVSATRSGNTLSITVSAGGKSGTFRSTLTLPSGASASNPAPVMIAIGGVDNNAYTRAGIAVATLDYLGVAPDGNGKTGAFWSLYNGQDIGALTAWAWGVHRTLDAIEKNVPEIDPKRTATCGCSRLGKAALAAGLFDDRILVTVPMSSGIQGLGPYRYWQLSGQGENLENSKQGAPWWTCSVISGFLNNHERLPYDSHFIAAAIAPRYLVIDEGQSDPYVNARGTATIVYPAVREVYKWLGVADRVGMAIRSGGHCDMSGQ
ncbi:hypothetical protein H1R20_g13080, partial [Candolleomyces eurysporus]